MPVFGIYDHIAKIIGCGIVADDPGKTHQRVGVGQADAEAGGVLHGLFNDLRRPGIGPIGRPEQPHDVAEPQIIRRISFRADAQPFQKFSSADTK